MIYIYFLRCYLLLPPKGELAHQQNSHVSWVFVPKADVDPSAYTQAKYYLEWKDAIIVEYDALMRNHTWYVVLLLEGKFVVVCKCVYETKYDVYVKTQET